MAAGKTHTDVVDHHLVEAARAKRALYNICNGLRSEDYKKGEELESVGDGIGNLDCWSVGGGVMVMCGAYRFGRECRNQRSWCRRGTGFRFWVVRTWTPWLQLVGRACSCDGIEVWCWWWEKGDVKKDFGCLLIQTPGFGAGRDCWCWRWSPQLSVSFCSVWGGQQQQHQQQ